jgi:hypothetical protein
MSKTRMSRKCIVGPALALGLTVLDDLSCPAHAGRTNRMPPNNISVLSEYPALISISLILT